MISTTWRGSFRRTTRSTRTAAREPRARNAARGRRRRMALERVGYVDLPPHASSGGFDHVAVHGRRGLMYAAHTANDAIDVIDGAPNRYLRPIPGFPRVPGAPVSEGPD